MRGQFIASSKVGHVVCLVEEDSSLGVSAQQGERLKTPIDRELRVPPPHHPVTANQMAKHGMIARFLRWLSDFFWPGDYDRDSAKEAYKAYLASGNVASLSAAIESFQFAVDHYRKHNSSSLVTTLINYAVAVWKHYETCGKSPEDLENVIRLDTEAQASWSGEKNTTTYLFLLNALAGAYFEQYQRAFGKNPIKPDGKQEAFNNAIKHYTELKDNPAAGSQRSATQVQLGVMFRMRSELEQTRDRFEIGLEHLKEALSEATEAGKEIHAGDESDEKQRQKAAVDDVKATCLLNLADSYEVHYTLSKDPRKLHDLTMAIDSNTEAKPLLEELQHPELPACLFNLGRQLRLRWLQTQDPSDFATAKQLAEAARDSVGVDHPLKQDIDLLVEVLQPESRRGTMDSMDMHAGGLTRRGTMYEAADNVRIPRRQGTVGSSMDI
ncbi:hypothetical protein D9619_008261 [Psilocybe cf. subviscida]|uniref:Uncharacterized protein n=1 Tax=Psilocybe cf. subviscida TaxID=2480587 RepID=A0A8H5ESD7_9AGAR|nr:hypothetical protein D9619_008261 [Psilocybe cf. subviscida]